MSEFKTYRRSGVTEMLEWQPGTDLAGVSISDVDRESGSPKPGDYIARNPANHADRWLVSAAFFASAKFEVVP